MRHRFDSAAATISDINLRRFLEQKENPETLPRSRSTGDLDRGACSMPSNGFPPTLPGALHVQPLYEQLLPAGFLQAAGRPKGRRQNRRVCTDITTSSLRA